jgi:MYXO-CTERM domain-containing protein
LALLLVGVSLQVPPTQATGDSLPHVRVKAIEVNAPHWVDGVANDTLVNVTVRNVGNATAFHYTIALQWKPVEADLQYLNNDDQAQSTDTSQVALGPNEAFVHHFTWHPSLAEVGLGRVFVTVDQGNEQQTANSTLVFFPFHQTSLQLSKKSVSLLPTETRFYRIYVNNTGNVVENVTLSLPGPSVGANNRLDRFVDPPRLTVPPKQGQVATLYLHYSGQDPGVPFEANYTVRARASIGLPLMANAPHAFSRTGTAGEFPPGYTFSAQAPGGDTVFMPLGGSATVPFLVQNTHPTGSSVDYSDTYHVTAMVSSSDPGWSAEPLVDPPCAMAPAAGGRLAQVNWTDEAAPPCLALHPGEQGTTRVRVAATSTPGTSATLYLTVSSDHAQQPPITLPVSLRVSGSSLAVQSGPVFSPRVLYVGDTGVALVTVTNQGNQASPAGCTVTVQPGSATASLASLAPGASQTVTVPLSLNPGPGTLTASIAQGACSNVGSSASTPLFVHAPAFTVTPPPMPFLSGSPGEKVGYLAPPYLFTVKNAGNAVENVTVRFGTDFGAADLEGDLALTLMPKEVRSVPVSHILPYPTGGRMAGNITLRVLLQDRPLSWQATTQTLVVDHQPPVLRVLEGPPAVWTRGVPIPLLVEATDGTAVRNVTATVAGPGGTEDTILAPTLAGWRPIPQIRLDLLGNYTLTLRSWDVVGNHATTAAIAIEAKDIAPPVLSVVGVGANTTLAYDGAVAILVHDALDVPTVRVSLLNDTGAPVSHAVFPVVNGTAYANMTRFPGLPAGLHTFLVEAANVAGAHSDTTFTVRTAAPPPPLVARRAHSNSTPGIPLEAALALLGVAALLARRR